MPRQLQADRYTDQVVDARVIAKWTRRLVVLGDTGAGKTWLAATISRDCAIAAREALRRGEPLDQIELPLYLRCSPLSGAVGEIWQAVASSAIDHLGNRIGPRLGLALKVFLADRTAPTLLVMDALDESHGVDEKIRQLVLLPWRIVLTSRPQSWHNQLAINEDHGDKIGLLRPLRYPEEVETYIENWFGPQTESARKLAIEIAKRPVIQQSASVPLLLALYCFTENDRPMPTSRHELYRSALTRMVARRLTGTSRPQAEQDSCLSELRTLAWRGATADPISGMGLWSDEISVPAPSASSLLNVLNAVMPSTGFTAKHAPDAPRRFAHRAFREYLAAEHIAMLPAERAATELLGHIWFDLDWQYAAPAALAMHPARDKVLQEITFRIGPQALPGAETDCGNAMKEFQHFLARLALESSEVEWQPEMADIIGQARVSLAHSDQSAELEVIAAWPKANVRAKQAVIAALRRADSEQTIRLTSVLAGLDPAPAELKQVRKIILSRICRDTGIEAAELAGPFVRLEPSAVELRTARDALLTLLTLNTPVLRAMVIANALRILSPTAADAQHVRQTLIALLTRETSADAVARLAMTALRWSKTESTTEYIAEALLVDMVSNSENGGIAELAAVIAMIGLAPDRVKGVRQRLLARLGSEDSSRRAIGLADALRWLRPDPEDLREARRTLLRVMGYETIGLALADLADTLTRMDPSAQDLVQARTALLALLARRPPDWTAWRLAYELARLHPAPEDQHEAGATLLISLAQETSGRSASYQASTLTLLNPSSDDLRAARAALGRLLGQEADRHAIALVADVLATLSPTPDETRQARRTIAARYSGSEAELRYLGTVLAKLQPTADELLAWRISPSQLGDELLSAIRRNEPASSWLAFLNLKGTPA